MMTTPDNLLFKQDAESGFGSLNLGKGIRNSMYPTHDLKVVLQKKMQKFKSH